MKIRQGIRSIVVFMAARRRYNHKRIELKEKILATEKAEQFAEATVAEALSFAKLAETELHILRTECDIMRKKASNLAKFAAEMVTSPTDTIDRIDQLEAHLMREFDAVRGRLGIPAARRRTTEARMVQ